MCFAQQKGCWNWNARVSDVQQRKGDYRVWPLSCRTFLEFNKCPWSEMARLALLPLSISCMSEMCRGRKRRQSASAARSTESVGSRCRSASWARLLLRELSLSRMPVLRTIEKQSATSVLIPFFCCSSFQDNTETPRWRHFLHRGKTAYRIQIVSQALF